MNDRPIWVFDDYEVDLRAWRLSKGGRPVAIEPKGLALLALLIERRGEVVGKSEILDEVWNDAAVTENAMVRVIAQVRAALGDDPKEPKYIETVHTRGYRFVAPVARADAPVLASAPRPVASSLAETPRGLGGAEQSGAPAGVTARSRRWRNWRIAAFLLGLAGAVSFGVWRSRDRTSPQGAPARDASGSSPSVAVLPLESLDQNVHPYFADGMTEALTTQLAKIEALKVISRSAVMRYRGEHPPPSAIARELGVVYVVEGSALLVGEKVRVTAHLVEGSSDRQLWAESYEGDLSDVLALQARIAREIVRAVRARVTPEEESRLAETRTVSPAAYEKYLEGLYHVDRVLAADADMLPSIRKSIECFRAATELQPDWGEAHGRLAEAYSRRAAMSDDHAERQLNHRLARASAEHALELDPSVVSAHLVLASELFLLENDWEGAEREFREVFRLQPNNADWSYQMFLRSAGRFDESVAMTRRAQERWPTSSLLPYNIGLTQICAGRLEEAEAEARELRDRFRDQVHATLLDAMVLSRRRRYAEAADLLESHRDALMVNRATTFLQELSWAAAKAGQPERARRAIAELRALGGLPQPSALLALGDPEGAVRDVEERYRRHDYTLQMARCWPDYENLKRLPGAGEILRQVGPPELR